MPGISSEGRDENLNEQVDRSSFTIESENDFPSLALDGKPFAAAPAAASKQKKVVPLGQQKGQAVNQKVGKQTTKQQQLVQQVKAQAAASKRASPDVLFRAQAGKSRKKKKCQKAV